MVTAAQGATRSAYYVDSLPVRDPVSRDRWMVTEE